MNYLADTRIFLCLTPTKMSYSFDSLMSQAEKIFAQNPLSGHLFLFLNRERDRMKMLYWDQDGFCIWYKKFESHYPHFLLFTGIGRYRDNLACRPAAAVGMDSGPPRIGPRRRPMPGEIAVIVPPRAELAAGP
jgi:transposase